MSDSGQYPSLPCITTLTSRCKDMKELPLNALRTFSLAAKWMSFRKAAEELNVTPTAVSHQVKHLEGMLGVSLFRRFPRPLSLTQEGQELYPKILAAMNQLAAACENVRSSIETELVESADQNG